MLSPSVMEGRLQAPYPTFKLPRRGHFFAAPSAKKRRKLTPSIEDGFLYQCDRFSRVQSPGAGARAVHDRMAAVKSERVMESLEPLLGSLVPAVDDPAIRLQEHRRAEVAVAGPPPARAPTG